jgi:threonine dehydrogenase-like Zn-dependent dehydrogenase
MQGVVFLGQRKLELRQFPDPTPGPREVIVEIKASGMCGSDLPPYRAGSEAFRPIVRGHEPCGVIVAHGRSVTEDEAPLGQRVMIHHYSGCGRCKHCRVGYAQMCLEGNLVYGATTHGGHADYILVRPHMLVPLVNELSFAEGAAISCGTGTAYGALKRLNLQGGETIAIFGQGPVGLSATQLAVAMGARVIALDVSPERCTLAREFGAHEVIEARSNNPVEAIKELTHGEGAHKTLDTSGNGEARAAAVRAARTWGTVCFVGERGQVTLDVSPDLIRRQITLVASWTFSVQGQADCAEFVADKKIAVDKLFTHRWRLDQAEEAYRVFDTQTSGKGVIVPS